MLGRILGSGLLALGLLVASANPALADSQHHRLVVFGDSLSDPGNAFVLLKTLEVPPFVSLIPDAPYARGALHFSNGPTWIEQLALREHTLSAGPALLRPRVFSNYAVGGARARYDGNFHLGAQVGLFVLDSGGHGPADALYVVFIGANDIRDALGALAYDSTGVTSAGMLQLALYAIRDNILTLYSAGARHLLVANAPDIALTPAVRMLGPTVQGAAHMLVTQFNGGLEAILHGLETSLGANITRFNVYGVLNSVVASPASVRLTNVTDPCIVLATLVNPYCARPDQYLFWDGIHPTKAGHRILAERAETALTIGAAPVAMRR